MSRPSIKIVKRSPRPRSGASLSSAPVVEEGPAVAAVCEQTVLTILTGSRPGLLQKTIAGLQQHAPGLLAKAEVHVLINGADRPSLDQVESMGHIHITETLLPIGPAVSFLMERALQSTNAYLLHLEDDWQCLGGATSWIGSAARHLQDGAGQVRLRHHNEMVMRAHALTHQPLRWKKLGLTAKRCDRAHYTFNPSLVSVEVARKVFPCESELDAMRKFDRLGKPVVQLVPGAFRHLGSGAASLAEKTGGR